jgi:hypothetical protein
MVVKGYVKDTDGNPIVGVSLVRLSNQTLGDLTNNNGYYQFDADLGSKIVVGILGYHSQTIKVVSSTTNITLERDETEIEPILITGSIKKDNKGCGILCYSLIGATILAILYKLNQPKKVVL